MMFYNYLIYIPNLNLLQVLLVGVVVLRNLHREHVSLLVVVKNLERGQVVHNNVGASVSNLLRVVSGANTNNHGTGLLTCGDTGRSILENGDFLLVGAVAQSGSGVLVAHRVGLTLGDLLGRDESVWLSDVHQLQPFRGQRQGTGCDNGPSLQTVLGLLLGELVERFHKLNGARNWSGVLAERVWNGTLPGSHLLLNGVLRRPFGNDIEGSASVRGSDDFLGVDMWSGLAEVSPELGDGTGRVDQSTVTVEKSGVDLEDGWLFLESHGCCVC
ncbi:hypothetical protein METSCH_C06730 [Metschnikowia aff. pulcherrima]|uniref:Uncharacterized protein n=1 Tax=Metschnikowia aff. pulcherrima TaxID=2163413 RepID=A0A4P6XSA3_9ASCO|nr:hypothetical protein METSCH_C06730 [Metschnikowia aff. pulcherrima]